MSEGTPFDWPDGSEATRSLVISRLGKRVPVTLAEDAARHAMQKALKAPEKFKDYPNMIAWMVKVARNHIKKFFVEDNRYRPLSPEVETTASTPPGTPPLACLKLLLLRGLLRELPDPEARVVRWSYFEGKTLDAISKLMGTNLTRVFRIRRAALKRLRLRFCQILPAPDAWEPADLRIRLRKLGLPAEACQILEGYYLDDLASVPGGERRRLAALILLRRCLLELKTRAAA